ncbi:MAG: hypothetical protein ACYCRH_06410 [Acidiferrobacteraceae bacterium]
MANLTITVTRDLLKRARLRAIEEGTSVNAVLRRYLESYVGEERLQEDAMSDLLQLSRTASARRGGHAWTRDELHER